MLVIRTAQMQMMREAMRRERRQNLAAHLQKALLRTGQTLDPQQVLIQLERVEDWSDRLQLDTVQTMRLIDVVIGGIGLFPNGPFPKAIMKILYNRQHSVDRRLELREHAV